MLLNSFPGDRRGTLGEELAIEARSPTLSPAEPFPEIVTQQSGRSRFCKKRPT
ncbi:hypothetical protein [Phormidium sp. CCY1219]|uniref:hypothetical protein n=1 Tax=Phormidium sp. CCY1219 TaxID=2886104 RepID=UPI002D1F6421|nr:hypothetical protein [Phormidium sp. CCY1219]MEB3829265.1 hypothetical protein [Phormidium sp. CCY1219]